MPWIPPSPISPTFPKQQSSDLFPIPEEAGQPINSTDGQDKPELLRLLDFLRTPLSPMVSATTGQVCPDYPKNLLAYHLLTSDQLDNLARHYHQVWPPTVETYHYPLAIQPWIFFGTGTYADLETKRRRFGRFIGLRPHQPPRNEREGEFDEVPLSPTTETVLQVLEYMDHEWKIGLAHHGPFGAK